MFHLQTFEGLQFNIPLESLKSRESRKKVAKSFRTRRTIDNETEEIVKNETDNKSSYAVNAYRDAIKISSKREPILHAYRIMKSPVLTVDPDMNVVDAWHLFREKEVSHMPVLSPDKKIIGIVSTGDLLKHLIIVDNKIENATDQKVKDIMTEEVITADRITDIRRIAQAMFENHIGTMPIVDERGAPLGIITRSDILYALINYPPLNLWG